MEEKSLPTVYLIEEYCLEHKRSQRTKHSNPNLLITKQANKLNRQFSKEKTQIINKIPKTALNIL